MADEGSPGPAPAELVTLLTHQVEWRGVVPYEEYSKCPAGAYGGSMNPMWQYRNEDENYNVPITLTFFMIFLPALAFWVFTISKNFQENRNSGFKNEKFSGRSVYGYTKDQLFSLTLFVSSAAIVNVNIAYAVPGFNAIALIALAVVYFLHDFYTAPNTFRETTWVPRAVFVQLGNLCIILSIFIFTLCVYCVTVPRDAHENETEEKGYNNAAGAFFFLIFTLGFGLRTCASAHLATPDNVTTDRRTQKAAPQNPAMFPTFSDGRDDPNGALLKEDHKMGLRKYHSDAYTRPFGPVLILANYEYYLINLCVYLFFAFEGLAVGVGVKQYAYGAIPLFFVPTIILFSLFFGIFYDQKNSDQKNTVWAVFVFNLIFVVLLFSTISYGYLHLEGIYRTIDDIKEVELLGNDMSHEHPDYNQDFLDKVEKWKLEAVVSMSLATLVPLFGLSGFMFPNKKQNQWGYRGT